MANPQATAEEAEAAGRTAYRASLPCDAPDYGREDRRARWRCGWKREQAASGESRRADAEVTMVDNLLAEIKRLHAETVRLSGCLIAINEAADTVPASVLRGIAYDAALNCISPDVAGYQIERRAAVNVEKV